VRDLLELAGRFPNGRFVGLAQASNVVAHSRHKPAQRLVVAQCNEIVERER